MTTKRFLKAWFTTTVVLFALNGVFHGLVAADFFDRNFAALGDVAVKMADFNPLPIMVLELLLAFSLTWILSITGSENNTLRGALTVGGLFHLSAAATWNLANMATFVYWPLQLAAGDIAWHILMGIVAGWLIYKLGLGNKK
ncbi:MAG: DUF2177 family protein [Saprospiraceae bacterium]